MDNERIEKLRNLQHKLNDALLCDPDNLALRNLELELINETAAEHKEPQAWEISARLNDLLWRY